MIPLAKRVQVTNAALADAVGVVAMEGENGHNLKKIPTRGHQHWTLTTIQDAADSATIKLKGTNNPDPSDNSGEDLITNTHAGSDQFDGSAANKGYDYVFVEVTAEGAGAGASFAASTGIRVAGTGNSGSG